MARAPRIAAFLKRTEETEMFNFDGNTKLDSRDEMILAIIALLTPLTAIPMVVFGA